jgi:hypothetical protein
MAQAVICQPLTVEVWVRSQVSLSGICGRQSGIRTGFSLSTLSTLVFPCHYQSTHAVCTYFIHLLLMIYSLS